MSINTQPAEAEELYTRTIQLRERVLGEAHEQTLVAQCNLTIVLEQQEKHEDARALYLENITRSQRALGPDHERTLEPLLALINNFRMHKMYTAAEEVYRKVVGD